MAHSDNFLVTRATRLVALLALLATSLFSAAVDPASQRSSPGRAALEAVAFLPAAADRTFGSSVAQIGEADRDGGPAEGPLDHAPGIAPSGFNPALSLSGTSPAGLGAQLHGAVPAGHNFSPRAPPLV